MWPIKWSNQETVTARLYFKVYVMNTMNTKSVLSDVKLAFLREIKQGYNTLHQ